MTPLPHLSEKLTSFEHWLSWKADSLQDTSRHKAAAFSRNTGLRTLAIISYGVLSLLLLWFQALRKKF